MINVYIDELTPCLKNSLTGELVETEVIQICRKSFLSKFNKKNGWYVNWSTLLSDNDVYALVLKGNVDIQGLVAVKADNDVGTLCISWMCASPENNKVLYEQPKFLGVGGHLFAIAVQISIQLGFKGLIYGFASNEKLLEHYANVSNAEILRIFHPYHFAIDEKTAEHLMEVYNFEWSNEKI